MQRAEMPSKAEILVRSVGSLRSPVLDEVLEWFEFKLDEEDKHAEDIVKARHPCDLGDSNMGAHARS